VQLHNLKLQQALIGLNVRQGARVKVPAKAERFRDLRGEKGPAIRRTKQTDHGRQYGRR